MPKVRANTVCFVDNGLRKEGDVFEYNGPPNGNLTVLDGQFAQPAPKAPAVAKTPLQRRPGRPRKAVSQDPQQG